MNRDDKLFILSQLKGDECQCGKSKRPMVSFCFQCYKKLPPDMQKALYSWFNNGYEEAYEEAIRYLGESIEEQRQEKFPLHLMDRKK